MPASIIFCRFKSWQGLDAPDGFRGGGGWLGWRGLGGDGGGGGGGGGGWVVDGGWRIQFQSFSLPTRRQKKTGCQKWDDLQAKSPGMAGAAFPKGSRSSTWAYLREFTCGKRKPKGQPQFRGSHKKKHGGFSGVVPRTLSKNQVLLKKNEKMSHQFNMGEGLEKTKMTIPMSASWK